MSRDNSIVIKNPQTKKPDMIKTTGLQFLDWGFMFFVASELEAFKAAYYYRDAPACEVEFSQSRGWMVTVFNEASKKLLRK